MDKVENLRQLLAEVVIGENGIRHYNEDVGILASSWPSEDDSRFDLSITVYEPNDLGLFPSQFQGLVLKLDGENVTMTRQLNHRGNASFQRLPRGEYTLSITPIR